jgi:GxxExxY protein
MDTRRNTEVTENTENFLENDRTNLIIGSAIEVHRVLGPGLLESVYEECLAWELAKTGLIVERQRQVPISYKGVQIDPGFRIDMLVGNSVVVELKTVEKLLPIHEAQILTYMRLGGWRVGLLINFNETVLSRGIKRRVI